MRPALSNRSVAPRRRRRHLPAGLLAGLLAAACGGEPEAAPAPATAPTPAAVGPAAAGPAAAPASTAIDLGRPVCGECCTGKLWSALSALPGIRDIDARPGRSVVTVYHEGLAAQHDILARVQAAGDTAAALTGADQGAAPEKKWVRTAPPRRP